MVRVCPEVMSIRALAFVQACFSGGMFALGAQHAINGHSEDYMDLAKELAKTCHESYQRTGT